MITALPSGTFEFTFYGAPTGLAGTMRWRLEDGQGNVVAGFNWSTAGFVESPAGSGAYTLTGAAPGTRETYTLVVNDGSTPTPANTITEDLRVGGASSFDSSNAGTYTTIDAVRQVLSPDGDPSATLGTAASLSDEEIQEAIDEGAAEIDARLGARYTVPFEAPIPSILEKLNRDIAAYLATLVYRRGDPIDSNDPVQLRYNRAQGLLTAIQNGKAELSVDTGALAESGDAEVINPYEGDLFELGDFALGAGSYRYPGTMPGYDDGLL